MGITFSPETFHSYFSKEGSVTWARFEREWNLAPAHTASYFWNAFRTME